MTKPNRNRSKRELEIWNEIQEELKKTPRDREKLMGLIHQHATERLGFEPSVTYPFDIETDHILGQEGEQQQPENIDTNEVESPDEATDKTDLSRAASFKAFLKKLFKILD